MKKAIIALAFAALVGSGAVAQEPVAFVEDPGQGYLFNSFKDNWFLTVDGGAGVYFSHADRARALKDRFAPAAGLYVGKWFSPIIGVRAGVSFLVEKAMSDLSYVPGVRYTANGPQKINGYYNQKFNEVGPAFDAMLNITNWWCGYKPGRVYNAIGYIGVGGYFPFAKDYVKSGSSYKSDGYKYAHDAVLTARIGLINQFRVSEQVALSLDLRINAMDNHRDQLNRSRTSYDAQAYLGFTYFFKQREWNAPVVPVFPEPENCDAIRAQLEKALADIAALEAELKNLKNQPKPQPQIIEKRPLCTIYFPINVSALTYKDKKLLNACANVMKQNPGTKYDVIGWADTYTGTEKFNANLREARAKSVVKQLERAGVPSTQLVSKASGNENRLEQANRELGLKYVALDRCTTIEQQ